MKKMFILAAIAMMAFSASASAQGKFGITAGMNFNTSKFNDLDVKAKAGWSAGVTYGVDLPLGFSIQPSLMYQQRGANLADGVSQTMGFIELPVSVQWGPDLLIFRPFLDVTPYVGYALSNQFVADIPLADYEDNSWDGKQRFEYGLGVGAGVDIWKFRVIARYNWNFGSLYDVEGWDDIKEQLNLKDLNEENPNFGGLSISLAFFF